ncbi:MAG: phenylacetate--CoA ligase family protein, partial [Candidatus Competibacteraceae bacterium]|nr:phenylacetate--CoA ligase family protein [Candidatus Competibacteraceae bacterium]
QLQRIRLVVEQQDHNDSMTLHCETTQGNESLQQAIAATLREVTKLRGQVAFVAPGSLPNDGKVIDDRRRYD